MALKRFAPVFEAVSVIHVSRTGAPVNRFPKGSFTKVSPSFWKDNTNNPVTADTRYYPASVHFFSKPL